MFECVEFESGGKDVEVKLWRCRAKLLKCLIFAAHFKLIYMLPPSKVIFITWCSRRSLYLRHAIWNFGRRAQDRHFGIEDLPRLKCLAVLTDAIIAIVMHD